MPCEMDLEDGSVCLSTVRQEICPNERNHSLNCFLPWLNICKMLELNPDTGKPDVEYWLYQSGIYWKWIDVIDSL